MHNSVMPQSPMEKVAQTSCLQARMPALPHVWLGLVAACCFCMALSGCDKLPPITNGNGDAPSAEVALVPSPITARFDSAFVCSIKVSKAPNLLAAKFHLHYPTALMKLQADPRLSDSTDVSFLEFTRNDTTGSLTLFLASPDSLPNDRALCTLSFQSLQRAGIDSIYFARSSGLTTLRDTLNNTIPIGRFGAARIEIRSTLAKRK